MHIAKTLLVSVSLCLCGQVMTENQTITQWRRRPCHLYTDAIFSNGQLQLPLQG
jgi:hypothetical protein